MTSRSALVSGRVAHMDSLEARRLMCVDHALSSLPTDIGFYPETLVAADASSTSTTNNLAAASAVPAYSSLPGAADTLYLDFDGHFEATWGSYSNITTPEFNTDNTAGFSSGELTAIYNIWRHVSEDYAPFNINVTTVEPSSFANAVGLRVAIGGNSSWLGSSAGGVAYVNSYTNSIVNTVYVFPDHLGKNTKNIAEASSHESGHAFGLQHQSSYDANGVKVSEYYAGPGDGRAPIMGNSYSATRGLWWNGTSATSSTTIQDDMAVIAKTANTFGYRTDDHANAAATATPLLVNGTSISGAGVIEKTTDADYFSFTTGAGTVTLNLSVSYANNLDSRLELRSEDGNTLIAFAQPTTSFAASITTNLSAGSYRLVAMSNGQYGDVGQYTLSGTIVAAGEVVNAPTNLLASAAGTQVQVTWADNATNEVGYRLQRSTSSDFSGATTIDLGAGSTSYLDTGLTEGTTYFYRVLAVGATLNSGYSNVGSATTVPSAVTSTSASATSSTQVAVSWNNVAGETGYRVERSLDGTNWSSAGTVGADVTSFTDAGRAALTTYYYQVVALNAAGEALAGPIASATTPAAPVIPAAPSSLRLNGTVTSKLVPIAWNDNSSNETGFYIERSTNNGKSYSRIATVGAGATSYNDTAVSKRKTYLYRVQAYNAAGVSAYSNVLSASTPNASPNAAPALGNGVSTSSPSTSSSANVPAPAKRGSPFSDASILDDVLA